MELKNKIAVLGLGYIGLPFTAALANVGFRVIGVDVNKKRIEQLKKGDMPFYEPGVKETLEKNKNKIEYTNETSYALANSDTIFITVGTPVNEKDEPDYSQIDSCMNEVGKNLKKGHLIVLKSTVVIGTTEEHVAPMLEKISGLKVGKDFFLAFCPERTIEGLALHEIYNLPKIIGGVNKESAERTDMVLKKLGSKTMIVSSPRVAELCKLVDNMFRATNIAFANEIGMVCEKIGINAKEVVSAVNNSYSRTMIFSPGLGADGPCLSKDPIIFKHSAIKHGIQTPVVDGCNIQNKFSTIRIADIVMKFINERSLDSINLSMIGLAFKGFPETDDLRGSPAKKILDALKRKGVKIDSLGLYDPLVRDFEGKTLASSITEAVEGANIVLFLTNHPKLSNIELNEIAEKIKMPSLICDCWGNLLYDSIPEGVNYFRIGNGNVLKNI